MKVKSIFALIGGSVMQWYDFSLMGILAPILAKVFFPSDNPIAALLYTFASFAVSFILAPIGAILFGHIGDRLGRKRVLTITIIAMTIPTALISLIPSYTQIGISAAFILVILRLAQGLSAAPEFSAASVFMVESANRNRQAFYGSLSTLGYTLGMILGGVISWQVLTHFHSVTWAWRIPFALSILGGLIVLLLRIHLLEPFVQKVRVKTPLIDAMTHNKRACLFSLGTAWYQGVFANGVFVWSITYLHVFKKWPFSSVLWVTTLSMFCTAMTQPIFGLVADNIGKRRHAIIALIVLLILMLPLIYLIKIESLPSVSIGLIVAGILMGFALAPINTMAILKFKPEHRMSGFGTFFNISIAVFGGTTPLVLTALYHWHSDLVVVYFLLAFLVGLISTIFLD